MLVSQPSGSRTSSRVLSGIVYPRVGLVGFGWVWLGLIGLDWVGLGATRQDRSRKKRQPRSGRAGARDCLCMSLVLERVVVLGIIRLMSSRLWGVGKAHVKSVCVNRSHGRMAAPGTGTARSGPTAPLQRLAELAGIFDHGDAACVSGADTLARPPCSVCHLDRNDGARHPPLHPPFDAAMELKSQHTHACFFSLLL